jgi:hypothetical protein
MPYMRDSRKPFGNNNNGPEIKERIVCGFSYLSMGMVALIYYLFKGGRGASPFFLFHFYQSILAGLFIMMFGWAVGALMSVVKGLLEMVPGAPLHALSWVATGFMIIQSALWLVLLYGAIFAFLGKLADIPGISKLARMQMR